MRSKCYHCYRPDNACLCKHIDPFPTKTKFCLLMHPKEAKKQKIGTGRATHRFLENSVLYIGVNFNDHKEFNNLLNDPSYYPVLLYPGKNALDLTGAKKLALPEGKNLLIIVIDGTWPCAKIVMRESSKLHNLPRFSFRSDRLSKFLIKHQPDEQCLSTIESVEVLLEELARLGQEEANPKYKKLTAYLEQIVKFQIACSKDPSKQNYRNRGIFIPSERDPAKRWQGRSIFFNSKDK